MRPVIGRLSDYESSGLEASDVALRRDNVRELHARGKPGRIRVRIVLEPQVVDVQRRVAAPAQPLEGTADWILREGDPAPRAVRKSKADVTDLDAVQPD